MLTMVLFLDTIFKSFCLCCCMQMLHVVVISKEPTVEFSYEDSVQARILKLRLRGLKISE